MTDLKVVLDESPVSDVIRIPSYRSLAFVYDEGESMINAAQIEKLGINEFRGLAPVLAWCHQRGLADARLDILFTELVEILRTCGIPIDRNNFTLTTLHPQVLAESVEWNSETGPSYYERFRGAAISNEPHETPAKVIMEGERSYLDVSFESTPDAALEFPFYAELKASGYTGYLAVGIDSTGQSRHLWSAATKVPGGFTAEHRRLLRFVAGALTPVLAFQSMRMIARNICHTYLGANTGERVLAGDIRRGIVETIHAVIWFCDLRDFTGHSERLGIVGVTDLVNDFFDAVARSVTTHGGEILKFIGDAALAIFPIADPTQAPVVCAQALAAVQRMSQEIEKTNLRLESASKVRIAHGIGLHLGEVSYGNVGSKARLDFTIIGTAVNLAARVESLTASLGHSVLMTQAVAEHLEPHGVKAVGLHSLKGIAEPQQLYARCVLDEHSK